MPQSNGFRIIPEYVPASPLGGPLYGPHPAHPPLCFFNFLVFFPFFLRDRLNALKVLEEKRIYFEVKIIIRGGCIEFAKSRSIFLFSFLDPG